MARLQGGLAILSALWMGAFSRQRPLMEMGFGSFDLNCWRYAHGSVNGWGVELKPTFFFHYTTPQAMIEYFQRGKQVPYLIGCSYSYLPKKSVSG